MQRDPADHPPWLGGKQLETSWYRNAWRSIDPLAYLTATLTAIANGHARSRLDELLPGPFSCASS
jgi:hypothetical protein